MLQSDLYDYSDAYIVAKATIGVTTIAIMIMHMIRNQLLKIMHYLLAVFQKLIMHLLTMQKTQIL